MDRVKIYLLPFLILFLLVSLVVGFRSFLLTHIIEPVVLLCWAVWRVVTSVDQNIYWIILIVFCAIFVFRLIPAGNSKSPSSAYNDRYKTLSRVEYWQTLMLDAAFGKKESAKLREDLQQLLIASIAQTEQSDSTEPREFTAKDKVSLSPAAQRYLYPPRAKFGRCSENLQLNITFLVPGRLRNRARMYLNQDNIVIDEILRWMETELEINYE